MAINKTLKKDTKIAEQGTKMLVNGNERKKLIVDTIKEVAELKKKREAINAQIREKLQTNVKGVLNMKLADFSFACRIYDLESADRDEMFTTLQETFNALGLGGQLDFIDALKPSESESTGSEVGDKGRTKHAGYEAGRRGAESTENPHKKGSIQANIWHENWLRGQSDIADGMDKNKTGGGDAAPKSITRKAAGPKK